MDFLSLGTGTKSACAGSITGKRLTRQRRRQIGEEIHPFNSEYVVHHPDILLQTKCTGGSVFVRGSTEKKQRGNYFIVSYIKCKQNLPIKPINLKQNYSLIYPW